MFSITTEITFHAGHFITLPGDMTEELHFHDWKLQCTVAREELDEYGLVMDFHYLIRLMHKAVLPMEKADSVNAMAEFEGKNPSTEVMARYIYEKLAAQIETPLRITEIILWEMPDCFATYRPGK